ncbi:hypothetical protein J6590_038012 [Homalodisca vitripennis]|nr:hypothetical protein J6590_038012 [Homalodisca vitripennis]
MTNIGKADLVGPWQFSSIPSGRLHRPLALCGNVARPIKSALGTQRVNMHTHNRCGHAVHEDLPADVANVVSAFLIRNKFTQSKDSEYRFK